MNYWEKRLPRSASRFIQPPPPVVAVPPKKRKKVKVLRWDLVTRNRTMNTKRIIDAVSIVTGVHKAAILSACRQKHIVKARHVAMHLSRKHTNLSFPVIGMVFHRDHSSVVHAHQVAPERYGATIEAAERCLGIAKTGT